MLELRHLVYFVKTRCFLKRCEQAMLFRVTVKLYEYSRIE